MSKPTLPATLPGGGPWQLVSAHYEADCSPCDLSSAELYGEPNASGNPPTYTSIPSGTPLWAAGAGNRTNAIVEADITPWMQSRSSSWFGLTALDGTPPNGPLTALASYPASGDDILFRYVEAPPPSHVTSPVDGAVIATTAPTLTAQVVDPAPPNQVLYDFKLSTAPGGGGVSVIDSGWVNAPSWPVPPGALADGVTYYARVLNIDNSDLYEPNSQYYVPPIPGPQTSFQVKSRLNSGGPAPTDTVGSVPGNTSTPSQGSPSPGTAPASETVNMVTGDLALAVGTRSMTTLAGQAGVSLSYNSSQSSLSTGSNYGVNAQYYADNGSHTFPTAPIGRRVDPGVNIAPTGLNALTASLPAGSNFMVRWTGTLSLPAGTWAVGGLNTLGGLRVFVNGASSPAYDDWPAANAYDGVPHYSTSTITGGTQRYPIEVDAWSQGTVGAGGLLPTIQLWAKNATITDPTQQSQFLVSPNWLTPTPSSLPPGWDIGLPNAVWSRVDDLGSQVVVESQTGATATFTRTADGTYQAPSGDNDYLSLRAGILQLATSANYLYTFNADGSVATTTSVADDRHPTALRYSYSGTPALMRTITDPVSTRAINFYYGGDTSCPASNAAPIGVLCLAANWDGTSTSFGYNSNGQLAAVYSDGGQTTLLGYDSNNRVNDIRDALAEDDIAAGQPGLPSSCLSVTATRCPLDTQITYDSVGRVASVVQPAPAPGATAPARTYTYGVGTTSVAVAGFNPAPDGIASSVTYDAQSKITSQTNATGQHSYTVWDSIDEPIVVVDISGEQTSTVYDNAGNVTDAYGPAPVACFAPASWPASLPAPTSPVVGYLPVSDPAGTTGCGIPSVGHTHNGYDENITGLAESYWSNGDFAGSATQHSTGVGGSYTGCSQAGPISSSPPPWPAVATALCGSWASSSPPVTPDANGNWSLRMSGTLNWTAVAGDYVFLYSAPLPTSLYIDGTLVATNLDPNDPYNASGVLPSADGSVHLTPGTHTVRVDINGSTSQTTSYGIIYRLDEPDPGHAGQDTLGPWTGISLAGTSPHYGLHTSSTDADGKTTTTSYTSTAVGPEDGLPTATTVGAGTSAALTTTTTYESPGPTSYLRKTSSVLPAGNATTYAYYSGTAGPLAAACGVSAAMPQAGQLQSLTDPTPATGVAAREQQFIYDAAGRQAGRRVGPASLIASAPWQCTTSDTRGRLLAESWPATATAPARTVTRSYAVSGNPLTSSVTDTSGGGVVSTTVDLLGRLTSYTDANGKTTATTYDLAGRVVGSSGPQGNLTYVYNANGDPSTISLGSTVLATSHFDAATDRLTSVTYGNGTTGTIGYDIYGNQNALTFMNTASGAFLDGNQVTRSLGGRVFSELENINGTSLTNPNPAGASSTDYSYDGAGRLITAALPAGIATYGYGTNAGSDGCVTTGGGLNTNRTSVVTTSHAGVSTSIDSCYNNADQLTKSIAATSTSTNYVYDGHGNQTADNGTMLTWDASDRLASTSTASSTTVYTYDALDRVTKRLTGTSAVYYAYNGFTDAPAATLDTNLGVVQTFIGLPGGVMLTTPTSGNIWSYPDLHGNYTVVTNNVGTRQGGPDTYDPWGRPTAGQTPLNNATDASNLGAFGVAGKVTDTTTNITLMGARAYNSSEGRFLSVDPVQNGCANPYTYVYGDPLNQRDLTGRSSCGDSAAAGFIGGLVAFGLTVASIAVEGPEVAFALGAAAAVIGTVAALTDAHGCVKEHDPEACAGLGLGIVGSVVGGTGLAVSSKLGADGLAAVGGTYGGAGLAADFGAGYSSIACGVSNLVSGALDYLGGLLNGFFNGIARIGYYA